MTDLTSLSTSRTPRALIHQRAFSRVRAKASLDDSQRRPPPALALRPRYDVDRLVADWDALRGFAAVVQPGQYHAGGWRGLSLIAPGGRGDWAGACLPAGLVPGKTPLLASTPYFEALLDGIPSAVVSARLLTLAPLARIETHSDWLMDLSAGMVRLHVPVVTRPQVEFVVGGIRYGLEPGTLWYADFSQPHSVANPTSVARVHLVIDAVASESLVDLFPSSYLARLEEDRLFVAPDVPADAALALPSPAVGFVVPTFFRSFVCGLRATGRAALHGTRMDEKEADPGDRPLVGTFRPRGGIPVLDLDGEPFAALTPLSADSFRLVGLPSCVTGRFDDRAVSFFYKEWRLARCALSPAERT